MKTVALALFTVVLIVVSYVAIARAVFASQSLTGEVDCLPDPIMRAEDNHMRVRCLNHRDLIIRFIGSE